MAKKQDTEEIIGMYIVNFFKSLFYFFKTCFYGVKKLPEKKSNFYTLGIITVFGVGLFLFKEKIWSYIPPDDTSLQKLKYAIYCAPGLPILYLYFKGEEHAKFIASFDEKFEEIGFFTKNKKRNAVSGEMQEFKMYPRFLGEEEAEGIKTYTFYSHIPLSEWKGKWERLEILLDCNIFEIKNAKTTKKVVKLDTVPASKIIPEIILWKDEFLSKKNFELVIGENMLERITFNLNNTPHVLVAGETGSGKSVILRNILWQCILKQAKIYMVDFKGGVEFGKQYERYGEVITKRQRVLEVLKELTVENEARLKLFRDMEVKNLHEYNEIIKDTDKKALCRIVVFIDELAEMTDKSGLLKDEKSLVEQIEKELSTLARLARATGINLVVGIQRPDAKVLTGQIKNNIPVRISGRFADKPASEIVLSNTKATELPAIKGRFLYKVGADTYQFQAYLFDDETMLKEVDYEVGSMLTQEKFEEDTSEDKKVALEKKEQSKDLLNKANLKSIESGVLVDKQDNNVTLEDDEYEGFEEDAEDNIFEYYEKESEENCEGGEYEEEGSFDDMLEEEMNRVDMIEDVTGEDDLFAQFMKEHKEEKEKSENDEETYEGF